jgi:S1-C subfamily serine protease|tara:strand:- start:58 stop:1359 length:1302 start_codon:yes stop_codon:yes gene_type:complete
MYKENKRIPDSNFVKAAWTSLLTFFRKSTVKTITIVVIAISLSTVINAYYRSIQESIHSGIVALYDNHPTIADALYDINGFVLNGKDFDQERKAKRTIYEGFGTVVVVATTSTAGAGRGTGFIIEVDDTSALIATNHHVVDQAINKPNEFKVTIQTAGSMWKYDAEIVGYDIISDIAIVKIYKQDNEEWEAIEWAEKDDYNTGTPVVVIGHGMSMMWTSTQGHVVYKDRYGMRPYNLMIQTDAVINQGNSGGPMFNLDGKVIGVAQSIYSPGRKIPGWDGVGMAISVDQARRSIDYILSPQYSAKGYVPYVDFPFVLGSFKLEDVKDIEKEDRYYSFFDYPPIGAPIPGKKVPVKSVGELAGFLQGDILLEINGEEARNSFKVLRETLKAFPGDVWTVKIRRGEEEIYIDVAMREVDIKPLIAAINARDKGAR